MSFFRSSIDYVTSIFRPSSSNNISANPQYHPVSTEELEIEQRLETSQLKRDSQTTFLPDFLIDQYGFLTQDNAPRIYRNRFQELLDKSVNSSRMILVYIHSPEHEDTRDFMKDVFVSQEFREFMKKKNLRSNTDGNNEDDDGSSNSSNNIEEDEEEEEEEDGDENELGRRRKELERRNVFSLFVCNIQSREGYQLSLSLRATKFPFLSILFNSSTIRSRNNNRTNERKIVSLGYLEGYDGKKDEFMQKLNSLYERSLPQFLSRTGERRRTVENTGTIDSQNNEFQRVLREDRERDRKSREEERKKKENEREEERKRVEKEREVKEKEEELKRNLEISVSMRKKLWEKYFATKLGEGSDDVTKVRFKFPNGCQVERVFRKSDKVRKLYYFIHSSEFMGESKWKPKRTSSMLHYRLSVNFPKRILNKFDNEISQEKLEGVIIFVDELSEENSENSELLKFE